MAIGMPGLLEWIILFGVVAMVAVIIVTSMRRARHRHGFPVLPLEPPPPAAPPSGGAAEPPGETTPPPRP